MKQLPTPEVYELEFRYMPWGKLIDELLKYIIEETPKNGTLLDLMCGPGYLLHKIQQARPDLRLCGVDIDSRYIEYAQKNYKDIRFICADARDWQPDNSFDAVVCTAGLHHIPFEEQQPFIAKIASTTKPKGYALLADPYISPYKTEKERKLAATELGQKYIKAIIENDGPTEVIKAGIDILHNDVLADGEYKTYTNRIDAIASQYFNSRVLKKTWPSKNTTYGDFYFIMHK